MQLSHLVVVVFFLRVSFPISLVHASVADVCDQIADEISSASGVYYPLSFQYMEDIYHYATSSTQNSVCSVEPGVAEDVGTILQILGSTQTPFGVKGGGHIMNPGFSSTAGIQIAMSRFNTVTYDASSGTATVGAGMIWDDVYQALEQYSVNVVGGRVSGIGVAGYTLGGGYSYLTNQYGLTLDTVQAFELVMPNGTVTTVTEATYPELYFGLRGGYNNFGIVTRFTYRTYPQGMVWGGQNTYLGTYADQVLAATANFQANVTDPKAALITTVDYDLGSTIFSILMFYDAPTPPSGIFDELLAIPNLTTDLATRTYYDLVLVEPTATSENMRGYYNTVPLETLTISLLEAVLVQCQYWGSALSGESEALISYDVEPFLSSILTHGSPSAYPPTRTQRYLPLNIYFSWTNSAYDEDMYNAILETAANITAVAEAEGQTDVSSAPHYPNYSIYSTPLADIYGASIYTLSALKATYDPDNVMGLTGGFKFSG